MSCQNRSAFRRQRAPSKSRTSHDAQKKTAQFSLTTGNAADAPAYERLRAAVLDTHLRPPAGIAILRRQGMATWMQAVEVRHDLPSDLAVPRSPSSLKGPPASEVVRILASLVVTFIAEPAHA